MPKQTRDEKGRIGYLSPGELSKRPIPVRFPLAVDALLRAMEDRSAFVRAAVQEKLERDGLLPKE